MVSRIEVFLREIKRWFSRSEWLIRVLGLPTSKESANLPGLIIIQIDGLSRPQLEKAIKNKRLPFINRLLEKEHYQIHSLYTGTPSSTPAVQGELFYGIKSIVPAFSFYDRESKKVQTMYEPNAALAIEKTLAAKGSNPLLKDGSGYCNVYGSGASETHFLRIFVWLGWCITCSQPFCIIIFSF